MNNLLFEIGFDKILWLLIIILIIYYFDSNINISTTNNQDSQIYNTESNINNNINDAININNIYVPINYNINKPIDTINNHTDTSNHTDTINYPAIVTDNSDISTNNLTITNTTDKSNKKLFYTKVKPILNKNINYSIINNTNNIANFLDDDILNLNTLNQNSQSITVDYNNIKQELNYENNNYKLLGSAINKYYNQYYLVYETNYIDSNLFCLPYQTLVNTVDCDIKYTNYANNKLYNYLLVNIDHKNNLYKIKYKIGPRSKIQNNEYIYIASGYLQFGPFQTTTFNE